jgi:hypothetical protein
VAVRKHLTQRLSPLLMTARIISTQQQNLYVCVRAGI